MTRTRAPSEFDFDGLSAEEAFAALGNEIRLDIVRVLWQADAAYRYADVTDAAETIPFTELRRQVDLEDNGQFNYHLSKLTPHFVRQTDDGYRLSEAGKRIARTVIAVSDADHVDFSTGLEEDCPLCESPLRIAYEDQWLRIRCTGCDGLFGDETPPGAVYFSNYPAAGLTGRTADEAFTAGLYRCMLDIAYMTRDVCRECAGVISTSMSVCDVHEPRAGCPCPHCGTRFPVWVEQRCEVCRFAKRLPVEPFVMSLTPVIAFLENLGIDVLAPSFQEVLELLQTRFETTVTQDPVRVTVAIEGESDTLTVVVDDDMDVLDIDREDKASSESL